MLTIFAVSDSIGETAEQVAEAAASQFSENVEVRRIPYVKSLEDVEDLMKDIRECEKSMIVSTIITVNVREYLTQKCVESNLSVINVLGPIINVASSLMINSHNIIQGLCGKLTRLTLKELKLWNLLCSMMIVKIIED